MNELDDPNYHDVDDQVGLNYRGAADDRGRNCELDVLVDRDDRVALGVRDDLQHQLGVADDFPLQMDALVVLCARHYFCEVRDQMKILVYRRVAWHIDAIAKNTNKD
jgi:hypothetical protein